MKRVGEGGRGCKDNLSHVLIHVYALLNIREYNISIGNHQFWFKTEAVSKGNYPLDYLLG